jgi:hypothetical protein
VKGLRNNVFLEGSREPKSVSIPVIETKPAEEKSYLDIQASKTHKSDETKDEAPKIIVSSVIEQNVVNRPDEPTINEVSQESS